MILLISTVQFLGSTINEAGVYVATFKNQFKKVYGTTFHKVSMAKRMEYAAKLLCEGCTASFAGREVGYAHPIKFNKQFQKHFGITPGRYKMEHMVRLRTIAK